MFREEYPFLRSDGRPGVRPYVYGNGVDSIMDCTEIGGGKTHQAIDLIQREHTPNASQDLFGPPNLFYGGKVLHVLHRISLCVALYMLLNDPDTMMYSDTKDPSNCKRLIICIDSL